MRTRRSTNRSNNTSNNVEEITDENNNNVVLSRSSSLLGIPNPPSRQSWGWWYLRYYVCVTHDKTTDKSGHDKIKEIIIQDYSAWTLLSSLLMTVTMSAILVFATGGRYSSNEHFIKNESLYKVDPKFKSSYAIGISVIDRYLPNILFNLKRRSKHFDYILSVLYIFLFSYASIQATLAAYSGIRGYNYYNGIPSILIYDAIGAEKLKHPQVYAYKSLNYTFLGGVIGILYCFDYWVGIGVFFIFYSGLIELKEITNKYHSSMNNVPILKIYYDDKNQKSRRSVWDWY